MSEKMIFTEGKKRDQKTSVATTVDQYVSRISEATDTKETETTGSDEKLSDVETTDNW